MSLEEEEISGTNGPLFSSLVSGSVCPESFPETTPASTSHFIHSLPVAAFTCDQQGRVILYNKAAVTLWDREPYAMKDMWCGSCRIFKTDGTQLPTDQCPITRALRKNRPINDYEIIIERPDGSQRNVLSYVEPVRNSHGTSQGAVVLLVDVTQHKRTEQELRRSESELRDFVETSNIGLHWVAADGRILWANQAELTLLGYAPGEYIGHHITEFHADLPVIENILACLIRGENIRDQAARLRCKDGSIRHVLINSSVLFRNGDFVHTRCFTHDITETKNILNL